jgi:hypothetical protein
MILYVERLTKILIYAVLIIIERLAFDFIIFLLLMAYIFYVVFRYIKAGVILVKVAYYIIHKLYGFFLPFYRSY